MENLGFLALIGLSLLFVVASVIYAFYIMNKWWWEDNTPVNIGTLCVGFAIASAIGSLFFIPINTEYSLRVIFWIVCSLAILVVLYIQIYDLIKKDGKDDGPDKSNWVYLYTAEATCYCMTIVIFSLKIL